MDPDFLFKGIAIGFSIAAPVGPIGLLCIRRSLSDGFSYGLLCGLGAATADGLFGFVAGLGLTAVSDFMTNYQALLSIVGGLFLCYLGYKAYKSTPPAEPAQVSAAGLLGAYGSTFLLTLFNPMTILCFSAIFAGLGIGASGAGYDSAILMVTGVFTGSALWWLTLSGLVSFFKTRISGRLMRMVNVLSGAVIFLFGAAMLTNAF